jgi:hypothetical protein
MAPDDMLAMFADPDQDNRVSKVWSNLLMGGKLARNVVRPLIEDSWRRCYQADVDPIGGSPLLRPVPGGM